MEICEIREILKQNTIQKRDHLEINRIFLRKIKLLIKSLISA